MSFGDKAMKGHDSPAPLPMYQRVALKHVPTIVRRRYDSDLGKPSTAPTHGVPPEGSRSEDDAGKDDNPAFASSNVDDVDSETEGTHMEGDTNAKLDANQDMQSSIEDFGAFAEDSRSRGGETENVNLAFGSSNVDDSAKREAEDTQMEGDTHMKFDINQYIQTCIEDFGLSTNLASEESNENRDEYTNHLLALNEANKSTQEEVHDQRNEFANLHHFLSEMNQSTREELNKNRNEYADSSSTLTGAVKSTHKDVGDDRRNQNVLLVGIVVYLVFAYFTCH